MALTVEDGSGIEGADAFITVEAADAYHASRRNAAWTAEVEAKEAAIVVASAYIYQRWGGRLKGRRVTANQGLSFPRENVYDRDGYAVTGIPLLLRAAVAEYALRALTGELMPDPVVDETGASLASRREKVGPLEEEYSYVNAMGQLFRRFPAADRLMQDFVHNGGGTYR
jgi:hypothetical protein